ncbi:L-2-hydroxyglutarate oxidase [Cryobacterium ruanii]|uniref:L-2-hydroxyglutarate oxidase n=1 Tax=Cryobacterium ruanii TaxID=1259197 RepID=A0A4R9AUG0_9MICO|nr:L-2-hydroxyglutarate oxidase [Cryobacterium ruanii]TFD69369.1 L-2-hydroxyglutarate oxidase [Cryobacterium ruanii]
MSAPRIIIIGGGIIGLAVAELLSRRRADVTVIEKEERWAAHQTGHNSGVIHAGPYYKPGSLKATMCTAGNKSMLAFAREHEIAFEACGKLIVAVNEKESPRLQALYDRALANGAPARLISAAEAREFEPNVAAIAALRIESTGIIDYGAVTRKLAELANRNGAELILGSEVVGIRVSDRNVTVDCDNGSHSGDVLINCAGLQSDRIATMAGLRPLARIVPFRGEYYELAASKRNLVRGLIYPVPDPKLPFLGVHLTRMIDGSVHAGPNAVLALAREGYSWNEFNARDTVSTLAYPGFLKLASRNVLTGGKEIARSLSKTLFASSLARLVPNISAQDIVRAGAGVRAQAILPDGTLADDFIIQKAARQVHVLNAPSPAATSALEIARHIVAMANLGL